MTNFSYVVMVCPQNLQRNGLVKKNMKSRASIKTQRSRYNCFAKSDCSYLKLVSAIFYFSSNDSP